MITIYSQTVSHLLIGTLNIWVLVQLRPNNLALIASMLHIEFWLIHLAKLQKNAFFEGVIWYFYNSSIQDAWSEEPDQAGVMEQGSESHPEQEKNAAEVVKEQLTLTTRLLTSPV